MVPALNGLPLTLPSQSLRIDKKERCPLLVRCDSEARVKLKEYSRLFQEALANDEALAREEGGNQGQELGENVGGIGGGAAGVWGVSALANGAYMAANPVAAMAIYGAAGFMGNVVGSKVGGEVGRNIGSSIAHRTHYVNLWKHRVWTTETGRAALLLVEVAARLGARHVSGDEKRQLRQLQNYLTLRIQQINRAYAQ